MPFLMFAAPAHGVWLHNTLRLASESTYQPETLTLLHELQTGIFLE